MTGLLAPMLVHVTFRLTVAEVDKVVAVLAMLNLRMTEVADVRIRCPPRWPVMPGYGRRSLVHTSDIFCSIRCLSPRLGARIGIRWVDMNDLERLRDPDIFIAFSPLSLREYVFLTMIWHAFFRTLTVAARCMDCLRISVPGSPKTGPSAFMSRQRTEFSKLSKLSPDKSRLPC